MSNGSRISNMSSWMGPKRNLVTITFIASTNVSKRICNCLFVCCCTQFAVNTCTKILNLSNTRTKIIEYNKFY